ncbi:18590_t:CDS:1, partial [Gigaspora margarita]
MGKINNKPNRNLNCRILIVRRSLHSSNPIFENHLNNLEYRIQQLENKQFKTKRLIKNVGQIRNSRQIRN